MTDADYDGGHLVMAKTCMAYRSGELNMKTIWQFLLCSIKWKKFEALKQTCKTQFDNVHNDI